MKKWSQYLKENQKNILNEFNKKDEEAVMADQERFTVSFEIELESDGHDEDDMYEAEQEARLDAARNYLGYDVDDYFLNEVRDGLEPESIGAFQPDDGEEILEWYFDNAELSEDSQNVAIVAIASAGSRALENAISDAIIKILERPVQSSNAMPFLKALFNNWPRRRELQDVLGWGDRQITMDFEVEGGKHFPQTLEKIAESKQAMTKIINHFVINTKSLKTEEGPNEIWPKAKKPFPIDDFLKLFSDETMEAYTEGANEIMDAYIDDLKGRWGYKEVGEVLDSTDAVNIKNWPQKVLKKYHDHLAEKVEEVVEDRVSHFETDPIEYLEEMGYEEYMWFDVDDWRERIRYSTGGYGCDVDDLERALEDNFPDFMSKYKNNLKFEEDASLTCGIEFSWDNPLYMTGLDVAIQYLEDFFEEYHSQSQFRMTPQTGLHVNVGYLSEEGVPEENYNFFKALMFLNHTYATKGVGFPSREYSAWTNDLKKPALNNIIKFVEKLPEESSHEDVLTKKSLMKKYLSRNFDELSGILSGQVVQQAQHMGAKSIGFNINYTSRRNYIEFRYPGKEEAANVKSMIKALKYYAFIVKAAADPNFKQREYVKDLIGFINNLKGEPESVTKMRFPKQVKKGEMILSMTSYHDNFKKILIYNMILAIKIADEALAADAKAKGLEWDERDTERETSLRARRIISEAINGLGSSFLDSLFNNTLPAFYLGLRAGGSAGPSVSIKQYRYYGDDIRGIEEVNKTLSAKSFQNDLDDRNYALAKDQRDPQDIVHYKEILELLLKSDDPGDFARHFLEYSNVVREATTGAAYNFQKEFGFSWKKEPSTSPNAAAAAEDEALTDRLADDIVNDLLETKKHFKRWKF